MEHARLMKNKAKANGKRFVYIAVGVAALGGLLFGFDTGVISGAILFIKEQFSLSTTMEEIVVSAVLIGAVTGAIIGGTLTDRFGRRRLIMLAGIIFTVSSIATALAQTVTVLITGRIVVGIAIGIASFISPLYIAELVPAKVRGALVAVNMLAITTGIVVAYVVDYALSGIQGWRYMFGVAVIPSIILAVAMWRLPDSPRWLISRSKVEQARQVLQRVRIVSDVSPEISEIQQSLAEQKGSGVTELFRPSLRMPLIVGVGLAIFQQITGINTVIYYAPTIFGFAGFETAGSAILAGAGLGILMLCIHVLAIYLMDRVGRRPLLLIGVAGQIIGLVILGAAFQFQQLSGLIGYLAIGSLAIYVASFAVGLGPVFWLMISEIYPLKARGAAMSVATAANWGMNLTVALTFLTLIGALGRAETFWLYGAIAVAAWVFFYRLVPETKGKSLEQIEEHWRAGKHPREMGKK
jgi:SP family galactose:H+ symporter-like MFS transporter